MCSVHANSAREAVIKLCTLPLLAGENVGHAFVVPTVATCVDLVVQVGHRARWSAPGSRDRRRTGPGRGRRRRGRGPLHHPDGTACAGRRLPAAPRAFRAHGFDLTSLLALVGLTMGALAGLLLGLGIVLCVTAWTRPRRSGRRRAVAAPRGAHQAGGSRRRHVRPRDRVPVAPSEARSALLGHCRLAVLGDRCVLRRVRGVRADRLSSAGADASDRTS